MKGPRGDFSAIDTALWSRTEPGFYLQLRSLIERARNDEQVEMLAVREAWLRLLNNTVVDLFDTEFVGAGQIERQKPQRVAKAFQQLKRNMYGPKIRQALGLPVADAGKPKTGKKSAQAALI